MKGRDILYTALFFAVIVLLSSFLFKRKPVPEPLFVSESLHDLIAVKWVGEKFYFMNTTDRDVYVLSLTARSTDPHISQKFTQSVRRLIPAQYRILVYSEMPLSRLVFGGLKTGSEMRLQVSYQYQDDGVRGPGKDMEMILQKEG